MCHSVQLLPDKIMEKLLLENVLSYMENRAMIGDSQRGKDIDMRADKRDGFLLGVYSIGGLRRAID